ncbi:hypothetical protein [Diplocloster agilis]|uniref:hypothetical protein n=1 Tax=Diplocloster agilis TaxID=2850323 RepID=UPI001EE95607|nr:hypothetical protein [Diplocloster agilis]
MSKKRIYDQKHLTTSQRIHIEKGLKFPERLECDKNGEIRTKIFYCNPNSSWQKGRIEKNMNTSGM